MSPRRTAARALPIALALSLPAAVAGAQQAPERGGVVVAGGLDAASTDAGRFAAAYTLHAGYEWRLGGSPFALRLAGDYWRQEGREPLVDAPRYTTVHGASLLARYTFAERGRVRPYALGGAGIRQLNVRSESGPLHAGPAGYSTQVYAADRRTGAAYILGVGAETRLGGTTLLLEGRATYLPLGMPAPGRSAVRGLLLPVTIGVRF